MKKNGELNYLWTTCSKPNNEFIVNVSFWMVAKKNFCLLFVLTKLGSVRKKPFFISQSNILNKWLWKERRMRFVRGESHFQLVKVRHTTRLCITHFNLKWCIAVTALGQLKLHWHFWKTVWRPYFVVLWCLKTFKKSLSSRINDKIFYINKSWYMNAEYFHHER